MPINLSLHNFKCFNDAQFAISPLTLLCGMNGVGKSSVLQSLLLAREAARKSSVPTTIPLNGLYSLDLGRVHDVVCHDATDETITISLQEQDGGAFLCKFDATSGKTEDTFLTVSSTEGNPFSFLAVDGDFTFVYLSAERNGPRDWQGIQSEPVASMGLGPHGEYVAEVLARCDRRSVREAVLHPSRKQGEMSNRHLLPQLELWLAELFPGIQVLPSEVQGANLAYVRFRQNRLDADWTRPVNSGFGLSYSLPILVAGLLAVPGAMLIVENPEAHLHPAGQSKIARFLGTVAASGVTVIVETHSDHVINGIRLACVDSEHPLKPDDVVIYHFAPGNQGAPAINTIHVNSRGNLTDWPVGFFDQFERDLADILNKRKHA